MLPEGSRGGSGRDQLDCPEERSHDCRNYGIYKHKILASQMLKDMDRVNFDTNFVLKRLKILLYRHKYMGRKVFIFKAMPDALAGRSGT